MKKVRDLIDFLQVSGDFSDILDVNIKGVCTLKEDKEKKDCLLFLFKDIPDNIDFSNYLLVFLPFELKANYKELKVYKNIIFISDIKLIFAKVLNFLYEDTQFNSYIDKSCHISGNVSFNPSKIYIGKNVVIGNSVFIGDYTSIEDNVVIADGVKIGNNCKIYPNVVVAKDTQIGNNVIIHSGAVIGSDGFGYERDGNLWYKIPQIGNVVLHDFVEIGALTAIDRATLGHTIIGYNTKIDNLCQIAHNVSIGKNCVIASQTGIAGSVEIGDNVMIAGKVGIKDHVKIGNNVIIAGGSEVWSDIEDNSFVSGSPARNHKKQLRILSIIEKLPDIYRLFKKLVKQYK